MALSTCYQVNSPDVINDTIENESVIINLADGFYYSLDDVGSVIWDAIDKQVPVSGIVDIIKIQYQGDNDEIETCVHEILAELEKEQLIIPGGSGDLSAASESNQEVKPFTKPVLNKFGDMQDLLLLDPIHEVDDKGWPYSGNQDG